MDERARVAKEIVSMSYQKDRGSYPVTQSPQQRGQNSQPVYKGARPDQMNPNSKTLP